MSKKIPKDRFEDIKMTVNGSYSMWNSSSKLEIYERSGIYKGDQQKRQKV